MGNNPHARDLQRKAAGDRADDQLELKAIHDGLAKRDAEIKKFCEQAADEIKAAGKISADTAANLAKLSESGLAVLARLDEVEQKLARRGGDQDLVIKTNGQLFTESDDFKALASKGRGTASISLKAVTSITSLTTGTGGVGAAIRPDRLEGVISPNLRTFTIRDLIMPGRTGSTAIEYVRESGYQNMANSVAEGAIRPQSDLSFELKTTPVRTIGHHMLASKQVLDDVPMLQSYIDGRMRYGLAYKEEQDLLGGDGTGQNLLGITPQSTAFNNVLRKAGDTKIDTLRRAILQCRIAEFRPNAIVLNPVDWADIELQKDSTGQYIWVNVSTGGEPKMWRVPVIDTNAVAADHFLVGAFDLGSQIFDREDASVSVSTEDGDNFKKGMVTILAEERLALAVMRPESFIYGAFTAP